MNGAHLHLLVNTTPILAAFTAAALFAVAVVRGSRQTWPVAALLALAVAAVATLATFLTGIGAVDVVADLPRTSDVALSQHHGRAVIASALVGVAAVVGVAIFIVARKRGRFGRDLAVVGFIAAAAASGALAFTGLAGGRINHPELQGPSDRASGPAHEH